MPKIVYVIRADNGLYKIGRTSNVTRRLNNFRSVLPFEIELVHSIPTENPAVLEARLHAHFERYNVKGEWYDLPLAAYQKLIAIESAEDLPSLIGGSTTKRPRKSLVLSPREWEALEQLAVDFGTTPPSGMTAGQPSWRSLMKEIARGELLVTRKEANHV